MYVIYNCFRNDGSPNLEASSNSQWEWIVNFDQIEVDALNIDANGPTAVWNKGAEEDSNVKFEEEYFHLKKKKLKENA